MPSLPEEDHVDALIAQFRRSQDLTLDLINEFRKLRTRVVITMAITILSVLVISTAIAYFVIDSDRIGRSEQLQAILDNQESIEDVILSNNAMHVRTQDMVSRCAKEVRP